MEYSWRKYTLAWECLLEPYVKQILMETHQSTYILEPLTLDILLGNWMCALNIRGTWILWCMHCQTMHCYKCNSNPDVCLHKQISLVGSSLFFQWHSHHALVYRVHVPFHIQVKSQLLTQISYCKNIGHETYVHGVYYFLVCRVVGYSN